MVEEFRIQNYFVTFISLLFLTVCGAYYERMQWMLGCEFLFSTHNARAARNTKGKVRPHEAVEMVRGRSAAAKGSGGKCGAQRGVAG